MESKNIDFQSFFETLSEEDLRDIVSSPKKRERILENYNTLKIQKIENILEKLNVEVILHDDKNFPEGLRNIPHPPYLIYIRGKLPKGECFGVVGSRSMSTYGKKCIEKLIPDISKVFTIISGGALGCDTQAHITTLQTSGKTIVVTGTGIDTHYPVKNEKVFEKVIQGTGAILSIFPIGELPMPYNFPIRNEIVVGLSKGVLVVEAKKRSGSLITAGLTLDLGKDLFSIPGDITHSGSSGTNMLIQKGEAKCVTESIDVLEEYDMLIKQSTHKKQLPLLDELESQIYVLISQEEYGIDTLSIKIGKNSSELSMKLSLLELKGIIKKNISGKYMLI